MTGQTGGMFPAVADSPASDLPIREVLGSLVDAVTATGTAVLVAPPGSGKTTLAPLALADHVTGRVVVAEPRRVAARAAAQRMASLTNTALGDLIGYSVRGERVVSAATRIEVVTTGLLVRRLQQDPELSGVDVVIVDECHERHVDTDLAVAFLADVRTNLRDDLIVVAASATAEADRIAMLLGGPAPVITAPSSPFDVDIRWSPPSSAVSPSLGARVDPALLRHVASVVRRALVEHDGDVLVFLPGVGEIERVAGLLADVDARIMRLHGGQSARDQDSALKALPERRVVLATAVAESSLTVPGVRVVVDAGLSREPRMDHARGLGSLVTVPVSRAGATQRSGRAGREAPGVAYRCWSAFDHERRPAQPSPEILVADLSDAVLQLARWGSVTGAGLPLPDAPPIAAVTVARQTLGALGAIDVDGKVTSRGERLSRVGVHPRLARALLDGADLVGAQVAAEIVAVLALDGRPSSDDLEECLRRLRRGDDPAAGRWKQEVRRLTRAVPREGSDRRRSISPGGDGSRAGRSVATGSVVALAYPERIARVRSEDSSVYLTAAGTAVRIVDGSVLSGEPWIAVADAHRPPGTPEARVRLAAAVSEDVAVVTAEPLVVNEREAGWIDGDVAVLRRRRLGAIVLWQRTDERPSRTERAAALHEGLRSEGLTLLNWTDAARALRQRLAFCHHAFGDDWPDVGDARLVSEVSRWLGPDLERASRRADLARIDVTGALRRLLSWRQAADLDEVAPERLRVPSGSRLRVDYGDPSAPVLAGKLQEFFGMTSTPRVGAGRVPVVVHLLSPAGRPAAITADLESFWGEGYRQVRAQLRGRYPRHPWPEDPTTATATRRVSHPRKSTDRQR